jgi:hypothetical protein
MLEPSLTRAEERLSSLLKWWVFIFTAALVVFILYPDKLISSIEALGSRLGWKFGTVEAKGERFWLVLAASLMVVLIASAWRASRNLVSNIFYAKIIIISKAVSSLGFLYLLIFKEHAFAYLLAALVDGLIFLITLLAYRSALASRV